MPEMLVRPPPSSRDLVFDDGEPMESIRHRKQMDLLCNSLENAWADRKDFFVGGNNALYFSETQSRRNDFRAPDVFVVLGVEDVERERKGWVVWEEDGKLPNVVIELLSESTEHVDRTDKMRIYGRTLRIPEYFLFDPFTSVLEGYTLDALRGTYVRKAEDERGRVYSEQLGLWLGTVTSKVSNIEAPWLRWIDSAGQVLPNFEETVARAARAETEAARAETEAARANAEAARAETEAARADAEAARAARLEAELAALKAERSSGGNAE